MQSFAFSLQLLQPVCLSVNWCAAAFRNCNSNISNCCNCNICIGPGVVGSLDGLFLPLATRFSLHFPSCCTHFPSSIWSYHFAKQFFKWFWSFVVAAACPLVVCYFLPARPTFGYSYFWCACKCLHKNEHIQQIFPLFLIEEPWCAPINFSTILMDPPLRLINIKNYD